MVLLRRPGIPIACCEQPGSRICSAPRRFAPRCAASGTRALHSVRDTRGERMREYTIGVVGGGLMGHGIAYLLAAAGHAARVFEPAAEVRATLPDRLRAIVELLDDDASVLDRVTAHDQLAHAVDGAQFVFEAAPEKLAVKQQLFAELENLVAADTILASNSSAIPTTDIARNLKIRERVVGTHFWNPPHLVPLVEVIQNPWTSTRTIARTIELLRNAGKTA